MEPGGRSRFVQRDSVAVLQTVSPAAGSSKPDQQAAAQASDAESRGLFGGEDHQFDGAPRAVTRALQRADRLEPAQHADRAVESAGVRNGVDMRARGDRGASSGSEPIQRANVLPTASSRIARPASRHRLFTNARPRTSASVKTTRVTTGGALPEIAPSASSSARQPLARSTRRAVIGSNLYRSDISPASCRARRTIAGNTAPSR